MIKPVSYKRHRFPPAIIAHAVWLYFRFPLSLRLLEEMLLERRIVISYETVRRWPLKLGPDYARCLKRKMPSRHDIWHLDEIMVTIGGRSIRTATCSMRSSRPAAIPKQPSDC